MRYLMLGTLTLLIGCASVQTAAICDATLALRDAHTQSLIADGGPQSQETGAALIGALDGGCEDV